MTADEDILTQALIQDDELQMAVLLEKTEEDPKVGESVVLDDLLAQCRSILKTMKED
jgi:hypothetical protein